MSHREYPIVGTPVWSLFIVRVPHPPAIFPHCCHTHWAPLPPSLLGAVPPFIKRDFEADSGPQYIYSLYSPLGDTVCRLITILLSPPQHLTQDRLIPSTAQIHPRPLLDPGQTHSRLIVDPE